MLRKHTRSGSAVEAACDLWHSLKRPIFLNCERCKRWREPGPPFEPYSVFTSQTLVLIRFSTLHGACSRRFGPLGSTRQCALLLDGCVRRAHKSLRPRAGPWPRRAHLGRWSCCPGEASPSDNSRLCVLLSPPFGRRPGQVGFQRLPGRRSQSRGRIVHRAECKQLGFLTEPSTNLATSRKCLLCLPDKTSKY